MTLGTFAPSTPQADADAGGLVPEVRAELLAAINAAYHGTARNRQTAIGPSQAGHPCARHLLYMAKGHDRTQRFNDPWPSILGTAGHAWLDTALRKANGRDQRPMPNVGRCPVDPTGMHNVRDDVHCAECRVQIWTPPTWITEGRVTVSAEHDLHGNGDAFHVPTGTVVDFKILGTTKFDELRKTPPDSNYWTKGDGVTYFRQIQAYGKGFANAGYDVRHVALGIFGRAKRLDQMFLITWPYDDMVTVHTLARLSAVRLLARAGVEPLALPPTPSEGACFFCPFKGSESEGLCEKGRN